MNKADAYQMYLSGLINENTYLSEMRVTDEHLMGLIREYAEISDELDRIKAEMKEKESRFKELEAHIRPVLESLEETEEKSLQVDEIIITIKRRGFDQQRVGYKELYEYLFERVNGAMKRIVEEAKEANTKTVTVSSQIGVQKLEHGILSRAYSMISSIWRRLFTIIGIENSRIDEALRNFHRGMN